jgi:hypothetical protein
MQTLERILKHIYYAVTELISNLNLPVPSARALLGFTFS